MKLFMRECFIGLYDQKKIILSISALGMLRAMNLFDSYIRRMLHSENNPFFFKGKTAEGMWATNAFCGFSFKEKWIILRM